MARIAVRNVISQMVECLFTGSARGATAAAVVATNLCVLYAEHPRRQGKSYQRGGEEHFEAGNVSFARLGLLVEGVGGVDAVPIAGT